MQRFSIVRLITLFIASIPFNFAINANAEAQIQRCDAPQDGVNKIICEHAILLSEYRKIASEQKTLINSGTLSASNLSAWKNDLFSCTDVHCVDISFSSWNDIAAKFKNGTAGKTGSIQGQTVSESATDPVSTLPPQENEMSQAETIAPSNQPHTIPANHMAETFTDETTHSPKNGDLWIILGPMFLIGSVMMGKRDRRYRTGIKGNPTRTRRLLGLTIVAVAFFITVKFK